MKSQDGLSVSSWMEERSEPIAFPATSALSSHQTCDVCVVGAGIAGLTIAYFLKREGKSVIVLDSGNIGGGQTGRSTAHAVNAMDDRYGDLERLHGAAVTTLVAQSHTAAINTLEKIIQRENIQCDWERVDGYLFQSSESDQPQLMKELESARNAGLKDLHWVDQVPLPFNAGHGIRFPRQGQFHPLKYLSGLARAIRSDGSDQPQSRIFTQSSVIKIQGGKESHVMTREGYTVDADEIVVATHTPINDRIAIHTKQAAYRTYVLGARIPRGSVPHCLFWDTDEPYHYVRVSPHPMAKNFELLIIGGEDHKTGQEEAPGQRYLALEQWARSRFSMIEGIEYQWSGQIMEPVDGLAFIGKNPMDEDNVFIVTGDSGNGITHATLGGILITDLIQGRPNPWEKIYRPDRINLKSSPRYAKENSNTLLQYVDWLRDPEITGPGEVGRGEGAVFKRGMHPIAAYRDSVGTLHECSAVCPHLGGVVHWNSAEKTWDCPCHGSRFDPFGKVVNGPSIEDLKEFDCEAEIPLSAKKITEISQTDLLSDPA